MTRNIPRCSGLIASGVLIAGLLAACGDDSATPSASGDPGSAAGKTVYYLSGEPLVPYFAAANKLFEAGMKDAGVDVKVLLNNYDPAKQAQQLGQAISQKPDLITIVPINQAALKPQLAQAKAAGIPVVFASTPEPDLLDEGLITTGIGPDWRALGKGAAESMQDALETNGIAEGNLIIISGATGEYATDELVGGFEDQIETTPQYKVIDKEDTLYDPTKAAQVAGALLSKHEAEGVHGVYGLAGGLQTAPAIRAAQRLGFPVGGTDGIVFVSSGCGADGITAMEEGLLASDALMTVGSIAAPTIQAVIDLLDGKDVEPRIVTDAPRFGPDEAAAHAEECKDN